MRRCNGEALVWSSDTFFRSRFYIILSDFLSVQLRKLPNNRHSLMERAPKILSRHPQRWLMEEASPNAAVRPVTGTSQPVAMLSLGS